MCGRTVSSIPQAIAADEEKVDFVLVAPPNEDIEERYPSVLLISSTQFAMILICFFMADGTHCCTLSSRALQDRIRIIRRSTAAHIIASHAFCLRAGGPRAVFNAGADGLQVSSCLLLQDYGFDTLRLFATQA